MKDTEENCSHDSNSLGFPMCLWNDVLALFSTNSESTDTKLNIANIKSLNPADSFLQPELAENKDLFWILFFLMHFLHF